MNPCSPGGSVNVISPSSTGASTGTPFGYSAGNAAFSLPGSARVASMGMLTAVPFTLCDPTARKSSPHSRGVRTITRTFCRLRLPPSSADSGASPLTATGSVTFELRTPGASTHSAWKRASKGASGVLAPPGVASAIVAAIAATVPNPAIQPIGLNLTRPTAASSSLSPSRDCRRSLAIPAASKRRRPRADSRPGRARCQGEHSDAPAPPRLHRGGGGERRPDPKMTS